MEKLLALKKYLPTILYSILGLVVLFAIYKIVMRFRAGGLAIGGIIADKAEDATISKETGISTARVQALRIIALNLSNEMETNKDQTWWWGAVHNITTDSDVLDILRNVKSAEEMRVVKNFYEQMFTTNRNMLNDLKDELSQSNLNIVPFISTLY